MKVKDITIIGGGPAGLYAAFYAGMRDLSVRIIETKKTLGGKVHFYPEKMIWDVGGIPAALGAELIDQMVEQGMTFNPEVILGQKVTTFTQVEQGGFKVITADGHQYFSKRIIIATGGGLFNPKRLPLTYNARFEETNLHHSVYRRSHFRNKKVVIVGGGNTAVDWANELLGIAKEIHLIHRNESFKAYEAATRQLAASKAKIYTHTLVKELIPNITGDRVRAIRMRKSKSNQDEHLELDELIVNIGFDNELNFHHDPKLRFNLKEDYYIEGTAKAETAVEGVYAVGDILDFDGKVRLIAGAYSDAANAVNQIKRSLDPKAAEKAQVSSHNHRFNQKNEEKRSRLFEE